MRPRISEFSYGFALTRELLQSPGLHTRAAPVFPSLFAEGQPGGGWDVHLDRPGVPLFLQFKLCNWMVTTRCREATDANFSTPCYRMYLRPAGVSNQHQMLLDLEMRNKEVYYCAPQFHRPAELNAAYLSGRVRSRTFWTRPSEIGALPDDSEHHFSFEQHGNRRARFSDYSETEAGLEFSDVARNLDRRLKSEGDSALRGESVDELLQTLRTIVEKRAGATLDDRASVLDSPGMSTPLQRIAHYASMFLESQLFIVQGK